MARKKQETDELSYQREKIKEIDDRMAIASRESDMNRARSVTVGTAFGGTTEVGMRTHSGIYAFSILQPVETIELIHQLAANVGCHLHLLPRKDFSSWRDWKVSEDELRHFRGEQLTSGVGHPPHLTQKSVDQLWELEHKMLEPEEQPGLAVNIPQKTEKKNAVATKKAVNKRRTSKAKTPS